MLKRNPNPVNALNSTQMEQIKGGIILTCEEKRHFKNGYLVKTETKWKIVDDGRDELTDVIDVTGMRMQFEKKPKKISASKAQSLISHYFPNGM